MANEKQRKTFLSYSRVNTDFAKKLAKELKAEGFPVWLDQLDIPLGARWDVALEKALEESEIFMIIMTPDSISSENVRDEIGYAIDTGKRFMPIMLEKCNIPLRLRRFQYVDFTTKSFEEGVESAKRLLRGLIVQDTIPRKTLPDDTQNRIAQAEADLKAKKDAERIAKRAADEELAVKAKGETEGKEKEETDRLAAKKAEADKLAKQKAEDERLAKAKAETERKEKEEADRMVAKKAEADKLAKQKAEDERLAKAKAETERKAKEEADRLAAQKAEADKLAKQKVDDGLAAKAREEAERNKKAKEKLAELPPVATKPALVPSTTTAEKKPISKGLVIGIVAVVVLCLAGVGIGLNALSNGGALATEVPATENPATERPSITNPVTIVPTATKVLVSATKTQLPSKSATPSNQQFYTEKFETSGALGNWHSFTLGSGEVSSLIIKQEDDHLLIDLGDEDLYLYYIYQPYDYDSVSLTMNVENLGRNNNNVSLVCRMKLDGSNSQWYEYSVESGGLWYLYAFDGSKYNIISNGGTDDLKQGQAVNEYKLDCNGDEITMYINGQKIRSVTQTKYVFNDGQVGFNISSLNVLPVTVTVNWFDISTP